MLCYAMSCYAVLCYAMLCYTMLCYAILCYAILCYVMLCYVMLYYVMLCYAVLCYAMLCYVSCIIHWFIRCMLSARYCQLLAFKIVFSILFQLLSLIADILCLFSNVTLNSYFSTLPYHFLLLPSLLFNLLSSSHSAPSFLNLPSPSPTPSPSHPFLSPLSAHLKVCMIFISIRDIFTS
jgi:hypothetical protein